MTDENAPIPPVEEPIRRGQPGPLARLIHLFMEVLEQLFLLGVAALTVYVAYLDLVEIFATPEPGVVLARVGLGQVLQFFLYAEVVAMVSVFFTKSGSLFTFPLFIAITALARLMVIDSKEIGAMDFVYKAVAILLLSLAIAVLSYARRD